MICKNCSAKSNDIRKLKTVFFGKDEIKLCPLCIKLAERNGIFDAQWHYHSIERTK